MEEEIHRAYHRQQRRGWTKAVLTVVAVAAFLAIQYWLAA